MEKSLKCVTTCSEYNVYIKIQISFLFLHVLSHSSPVMTKILVSVNNIKEMGVVGGDIYRSRFLNFGSGWWMITSSSRPFYPRENARYPFSSELGGLQNWTGNNGKERNFASLHVMETPFLSCPAFVLDARVTMLYRLLLLSILSAAFSISVVRLVHHIFMA